MKRTKKVNYVLFRKSWNSYHLIPITIAATAMFMFSSCEKNDETVSLYQNVDKCSTANAKLAECTKIYSDTSKKTENIMPKYTSNENCVANFGKDHCQQASNPAQDSITSENQAKEPLINSFWIPLMTGYMAGHTTNDSDSYHQQQQPLFSSKKSSSNSYNKYADLNEKNYGSSTLDHTVTIPKNNQSPTHQVTTNTITRNGFGELFNKQIRVRRSTTNSTFRSVGG